MTELKPCNEQYECPVCASDIEPEYLSMCEVEVNKIKADAFAAGFKEGLMLPMPSLPDNSETTIDRLAYNINRMAECAGREYANKLREQGE